MANPSPRIVASVYVDHQEAIRYPVRLVAGALRFAESIWLFGSDARNTDALREEMDGHPLSGRLRFAELGIGVRCPGDIAAAQNACIERVRREDPHDHLAVVQADTLVTDEGAANVRDFCVPGDRARAACFQVQHVRLHMRAHRTIYGLSVVGADSADRFVGDGAYLAGQGAFRTESDSCIDLGYHSVEAYCRHVRQHARTWSSPWLGRWSALCSQGTAESRLAFIRDAINHLRHHEYRGGVQAMMPLDGPYGAIVEASGLRAEYEEIRSIAGLA